jgi:hypothetical protein
MNQPNESCPSQDMGSDAAEYQYRYPPPPGEEYEHARAHHPYTSLNSSVILPSISYDSQSLQAGGYPQESKVNPQDSHTNAQQWSSDYGRDEVESWNGFQRMLFTPSAPRQRAAIACRYCRRRKVRHFSFLNSNMHKHIWFWVFFSGHKKEDFVSHDKLSRRRGGFRHACFTCLENLFVKTSTPMPFES